MDTFKHMTFTALVVLNMIVNGYAQSSSNHKFLDLKSTALRDTLYNLLPYVQKNEVMQLVIEEKDSMYTIYITATAQQSEVVFNPPTFDTVLRGVPIFVYLGSELFSRDDSYGRRLATKYSNRLENDLAKDGLSIRTNKTPPIHDPILVLVKYSKGRVLSVNASTHGLKKVPHLISAWDLFIVAEKKQH